MDTNQEFEMLFQKFVTGHIVPDELDRMLMVLGENNPQLEEIIKAELLLPTLFEQETLVAQIADRAEVNIRKRTQMRLSIFNNGFQWWRAAVVLLLCLSTILYLQHANNSPKNASGVVKILDRSPGGNRALLILSNGKSVVLDEQHDQLISRDGKILYTDGSSVVGVEDKAFMLTLQVPRKGFYRAILPDGTQVWLNADSKLTYPSRFSKADRIVQVEGEAYFEVSKMKGQKFIVELPQGKRVEVLGTHFNVNAYSGSVSIRTTLLEGSVRVISGRYSKLLKPGQQASQENGSESIAVKTINIDPIVAWKDNKFNFEGLSFEEIMGQIERWYDVQAVYKNSIPNIEFYGELSRNNSLQYIIRAFSDSGVNMELQGDKLIVLGKTNFN